MKNLITLCLGAALLSGCTGTTHTSPFDSRFTCEIPKASHYPVVSNKSDLLTNMQHLGEQAEAKNFVAGQWLVQTPDQAGKAKIKACSADLLTASEAIIEPQYESVRSKTMRADERAALTEAYRSWGAYMEAVTPDGVNDALRKAFKDAAEKYAGM